MRKAIFVLVAVILAVGFTAPGVLSDWVPDDGHKMHYPQLPDETGWDVNATAPVVLADDWQCSEAGWVKDIHFWGSWRHGIDGPIDSFVLSIHANLPPIPPDTPYSRPGTTLWELAVSDFIIIPITAPPLEGWYDPLDSSLFLDDHNMYYQYNVFLDEADWFRQEKDSIYWLNITAFVSDLETRWGWKSSQNHFMDDAVWGLWGELAWVDLWEPPDFEISLDLAFVITGGEEPIGACCYPDPTHGLLGLCIETTMDDCIINLGGSYQGDGTQCAGMQACCLGDGSCVDADSLCCADELGGQPQGAGTACTALEACCMWDGSCQNLDPLCCSDMGGIPQGSGTACTAPQACCLQDGSGNCVDVDPLCCDEMGGVPSPIGAPNCLGDGNGNGIDDACEEIEGACCWDDGTCTVETETDCVNNGGDYVGDGTNCLGDVNGNNIDDACESWQPGDSTKMHYPQLPDEEGWDVRATWPVFVSDDWQCSETGWVKDIHFWGSWRNGKVGYITNFFILIFSNIPDPDGPGPEYSRPGVGLWEFHVSEFNAIPFDPPTPEGWYDPTAEILPNDHQEYFQYDIMLPETDWFPQEKDSIYWLAISAMVEEPDSTVWGWKSSNDHFMDDGVWCVFDQFYWIDLWEPPDFEVSLDLAFVITGEKGLDSCDYYKAPYDDYAPYGMPDFDQKQDNWISPFTGNWSWCGPIALGNCIWWFDSKFEPNPVDPRPFYPGPGNPPPNDGYPLVVSYDTGSVFWDDHDTVNTPFFIQAVQRQCNTDVVCPGTALGDLETGFHNWLDSAGLTGTYTTYVVPGPEFEEIKDSILSCQDVILLLGFYELLAVDPGCQWLGGHYVTAAGVCTTETDVCISDPMFDKNEGEPPAGSAHGSTVHNDAANISGPHGTIHHDRYNLAPNIHTCPSPATWMFTDYPNGWPDVMVFENENPIDPSAGPVTYQGGPIVVLLDAALIICPYDTCANQYPGDADSDGNIDIYDVSYLVSYVCGSGPAPNPQANGDPNGDCYIDYLDIIYLIDFLFKSGPPPVQCTCVNPPKRIPAALDPKLGHSKHNTDGFKPTDGDPIGTTWHELFPVYCQDWTLTSWLDNDADNRLTAGDLIDFTDLVTGAVIWEKVRVVTPTLKLVNNSDPGDTIFVDLIQPANPTVAPMYNTIGSYWHEVYPDYCTQYIIIYNQSDQAGIPLYVGESITVQVLNGPNYGGCAAYTIVSIETDIKTAPLPYQGDINLHNTDGYVPSNGNPLETEWHELWPAYCENWVLTSWFDNGDGVLSLCDYVDFTKPGTPEWRKFHVEWVGPTLVVAIDQDTLYLEYIGHDLALMDPITDPIGRAWHEKWPEYSNVYIITGWIDNGNGYLDFCDNIIIEDAETEIRVQVHVESVDTDVLMREIVHDPPEPLPEGINLHNTQGWTPGAGETPLNTQWHELHPNYCANWTLTSWRDNGDGRLSVCDTVDFNNNTDTLYHVEWLGPTLVIDRPTPMYLDYIGFDNQLVNPITDIVGTYWHEVYPSYCQTWFCVAWFDNGNGIVDHCDSVVLQNLDTGEFGGYHVGSVDADMILEQLEVCDCIPGEADNSGNYNLLDATYIINYLYKNGPAPVPYAICSGDANCDCIVNLLDVTYIISYLYKNGDPPCSCEEWLSKCGPLRRK